LPRHIATHSIAHRLQFYSFFAEESHEGVDRAGLAFFAEESHEGVDRAGLGFLRVRWL
jgi:hypothetical protein